MFDERMYMGGHDALCVLYGAHKCVLIVLVSNGFAMFPQVALLRSVTSYPDRRYTTKTQVSVPFFPGDSFSLTKL